MLLIHLFRIFRSLPFFFSPNNSSPQFSINHHVEKRLHYEYNYCNSPTLFIPQVLTQLSNCCVSISTTVEKFRDAAFGKNVLVHPSASANPAQPHTNFADFTSSIGLGKPVVRLVGCFCSPKGCFCGGCRVADLVVE